MSTGKIASDLQTQMSSAAGDERVGVIEKGDVGLDTGIVQLFVFGIAGVHDRAVLVLKAVAV